MQGNVYSLATGKLVEVQKPAIQIGSIIWLNGYGQNPHHHDRKVVFSIDGDGYDAIISTVNLEKKQIEKHTLYTIRPASEIFGIGTYYNPGEMFEQMEELPRLIEEAKEAMNLEKIRQIQEAEKKTERERIEREALPTMYPYLIPRSSDPNSSGYALASKNIKRELAKEFPGVKFSVRSKSYSGGNSIDISWTDGPTSKEVEFFANRYQEGNFNGMEDIYEYSPRVFRDVFGGSKYVFCSRSLTPQRFIDVALEMGYTITVGKYGAIEGVDCDIEHAISRAAYERAYK